jgi:nucleotide-binding universal stress UspA family protein
LAQALWQLGPSPDVSVVPRLVAGAADTELVHAARDADLLVVGSRGRGALAAAVVGSTSRGCVHRSPCAVAVIP